MFVTKDTKNIYVFFFVGMSMVYAHAQILVPNTHGSQAIGFITER
jgi:hypothetical protein